MTSRQTFRDPVSGFTHLLGALLGAGGLVFLLISSAGVSDSLGRISFVVFGVSLILLYSSSALYHLPHLSESDRLLVRRIDHTMIFVLIAGTYTPYCLIPLRGTWGTAILKIEWGLTLAGLAQSLFWIHAPRWLSTGIYLVMGWVAVAAIYPLSHTLSSAGFFGLLAGGGFYTVGAVIYAIKWPDPFPPVFGFHEIWHLFVLAGSACHFASVVTLIR